MNRKNTSVQAKTITIEEVQYIIDKIDNKKKY